MADTPEQVLTSVRFDKTSLEDLQIVTEVHDTSMAEEIRTAVSRYISNLVNDDEFKAEILKSNVERQKRIDELLGL